jgi:hypothetical protein
MSTNPETINRITKKISLPSPTVQTFLKNILFNDETYLAFLENPQGSLISHGIELAPDVSKKLFEDFNSVIARAREGVKSSGVKLHFEDVFRLPVIEIDAGRVHIKQRTVGAVADAAVDVYYSTPESSDNRGSKTEFSKADAVPTSRSDSQHTKDFSSTSIFKHDFRQERFDRCPLLSAETLKQLTKAIVISEKKVKI